MSELKPASALRRFIGTDCCGTGRHYDKPTVQEIKEFKVSCDPDEYLELGQQAIDHLNSHV